MKLNETFLSPAQGEARRTRRRHASDDLTGINIAGLTSKPRPSTQAQPALVAERSSPGDRPTPVLATGRVNLSPRGFAFVTTQDFKAYYIRAEKTRRLLTGDVVQFSLRPSEDASSGEVDKIFRLRRREQVLLCGVSEVAGLTYFVPDEPCFTPVQLAVEPPPGSFSVGDVVAICIPAFDGRLVGVTDANSPLLGTFLTNLGLRTRDGFDLDYVRMKHGFDQDFPSQLQELATSFQNPPSRGPVEATPFVTIDGENTKDFDDAVWAEPRAGGGWNVKVAVSDVSLYVEPGTVLDQWAASRGTSVYLPGLTLPMLPEFLSTDNCSLLPGVARHAVVLHLELAMDGAVISRRIERTRIESAARLTYREVAAFFSEGQPAGRFDDAVQQNLQVLYAVYQALVARRKELGRLDFEDPEPTAKLRDGRIVVEWEVRNDAHKLVEELMLLANQEAAGMLVRRYGLGLFRHQPAPSADSWHSLNLWAKERGHDLPATPSLKAMSDLVAAMPEGDSQAAAVLKTRMSMQPARYVTHTSAQLAEVGGHFSLCAPWYTHFTSPIRRYADLLVHRLLLAPEADAMSPEQVQQLIAAVECCSERAQASRQAERYVWDRLKLNGFLGEHSVDSVLPARVVRATPRGFRVVLAGWQIAAWLPGSELRQAGIAKGPGDVWVRGEGEQSMPVREGAQLQVSWTAINLERPAYPELQVKVAG